MLFCCLDDDNKDNDDDDGDGGSGGGGDSAGCNRVLAGSSKPNKITESHSVLMRHHHLEVASQMLNALCCITPLPPLPSPPLPPSPLTACLHITLAVHSIVDLDNWPMFSFLLSGSDTRPVGLVVVVVVLQTSNLKPQDICVHFCPAQFTPHFDRSVT